MSEKINGANIVQHGASGHHMTVVVLHMATPADWGQTSPTGSQSGKTKFVKALEHMMNAGSPALTGPGGSLLMGLFLRTDAPGDAEALQAMRKDYPLSEGNLHQALQEINLVVGNELTLGDPETSRIRGILFSALEGSEVEPCDTCSGRGCPECELVESEEGDLTMLEWAYNLLCATNSQDADSYAPGWSQSFESFKDHYHKRLKAAYPSPKSEED